MMGTYHCGRPPDDATSPLADKILRLWTDIKVCSRHDRRPYSLLRVGDLTVVVQMPSPLRPPVSLHALVACVYQLIRLMPGPHP